MKVSAQTDVLSAARIRKRFTLSGGSKLSSADWPELVIEQLTHKPTTGLVRRPFELTLDAFAAFRARPRGAQSWRFCRAFVVSWPQTIRCTDFPILSEYE